MNKPKQMEAFGWPGIEPRWRMEERMVVGTAYAASSRVWFYLLERHPHRSFTIRRWTGHNSGTFSTSIIEGFFQNENGIRSPNSNSLPGHVLGYRGNNSDPGGK